MQHRTQHCTVNSLYTIHITVIPYCSLTTPLYKFSVTNDVKT